MSFNGSGTFLINSTGQPVVANTVISATVFNALTADLASGLTNCITKDGQTTPTANIPMGSNKITGLANGTLASDAANLGQVQTTAAKLIGTIAGVDTITGIMSPTLTAYAAGQLFYFIASGANTGAVTLNIDGLGAKAITRDGSTALAAGDINSGEIVVVIYDGTRFQMINAANSFGNTTINGTLTVTGKSNLAEVSTPSINASVAAVTTLTAAGASVTSANIGTAVVTNLTATGASVTSANVGTAVVTNLTATGASVASVNAGVALLTTATVTNLTATGASIASANIGSLTLSGISVASANFGVAVVTDLRVTGASVTSENVGTAVITTATVTNLTATGASVASANAGVANITDLRAVSASVTSANVGVAVVTTGTVTNLTATSASVASANAGVANVTDLRAVSASVTSANLGTAVITNGTVTTLTATSASVASVNAAVALVTTGTVTNLTSTAASIASANLGTAVITTLTATGASVASANVGVAATTTLTAVQASIGSANLLTARFLGATSGYVGIQGATNAGSTTYTLPSADGTSGQVLSTNGTGTLSWTSAGGGGTGDVVGPASATDNAVARFDLTTGKLIQNSSVIVDDSGSITGVASLAAVTASITSANAGTAVITTLTATGASVASANVGTAVVTGLTVTNASIASLNAGTATVTTGNLTFSSTAQRITGDMSNATIASRLLFQTSTTNGGTGLGAIPNGTGTTASFGAFNTSDPANTSLINLIATSTEVGLRNAITGTGSYLPMTFYTGGSERARITTTTGNLLVGTTTDVTGLSGVISDTYGNIRDVPQSGSNKTSAYTLSAGDTGRFIGVGTSGSIVIPNAVMAAGDVVTLYNSTSGNVTVECSISIAYIAGTNTDKASVTLATRGVATVLFLDSNNCVITGNVT